MTARPGRLLAAGVPRRADRSPEADWAMLLILLAWAEGHGQCGGLRPGPVPERPECPCGKLRLAVIRLVRITPAELAAVVLPPARTGAGR